MQRVYLKIQTTNTQDQKGEITLVNVRRQMAVYINIKISVTCQIHWGV